MPGLARTGYWPACGITRATAREDALVDPLGDASAPLQPSLQLPSHCLIQVALAVQYMSVHVYM